MGNISPIFLRAPLFWAALVGAVAFFEAVVLAKSLLVASFMPGMALSGNGGYGALLVLPAVPTASAFAYIVWQSLTSGGFDYQDITNDIWLKRAWKFVIGFSAILFGWALTLMVFGTYGPFGVVFEGMKELEPLLSPRYWPLVFGVGVAIIVILAVMMIASLKDDQDG